MIPLRSVSLLCAGLLLSGCFSSADSASESLALTEQSGAYSADLSPDGQHALIGAVSHGGSLWDLSQKARRFDWNHQSKAFSVLSAVDFSPEGRYALTASPQDLVLWNVATGTSEGFWSSPGEILDAELSSGGNYALLGLGNFEAVYFDIRRGGIRTSLRHPARVRSVALSSDERFALTGADDRVARFWDLENASELKQIELGNTVDTVALSPNGRLAFSAGSLDQALVWKTDTGETLFSLSGDENLFPRRLSYLSARFSTNSDQLLTGRADGTVELWDLNREQVLRRWKLDKQASYGPTSTGVIAVEFGPDGNSWLAVGSNGMINWLR
ncbi:WD domain-containing protein, G-beta repeat-containing protein [Marinobacterium sediminicola]|uniref:WD domain-containing protein, G-beta repeat-containing protein n=1 Tax=Marinobacterium sediminicola TaxID=518898 RepID=A0ABY1S1K3_9GAMM|nr:WD domain-containing protein, G-beta repeat-containing protein [Marinobacterium sediminicola]